jgi:hypothetical protein
MHVERLCCEHATMSEPKYWFPAKRYGWGWGLPGTWQGWLILLIFFMALLAGAPFILPRYGEAAFVGYAVVLTVLLVAICWVKGEPPRWRWGDKRR